MLKKINDQGHIFNTIKSRTHNWLRLYINESAINHKNSHKNFMGVLKINFTM